MRAPHAAQVRQLRSTVEELRQQNEEVLRALRSMKLLAQPQPPLTPSRRESPTTPAQTPAAEGGFGADHEHFSAAIARALPAPPTRPPSAASLSRRGSVDGSVTAARRPSSRASSRREVIVRLRSLRTMVDNALGEIASVK
jgi:hypothetical protein